MDLSIIIVSWNVQEFLGRLIDSIIHFTDDIQFEIIVVDNNSSDGTAEHLEKNYSSWIKSEKIKIIKNDYNAGFSKANNQGFKISRGKFILFMNPDMELVENSLPKLLKFMETAPNVGICACRLVYGDKSIQPNVKNDPTFFSQLLILLKLHHIFYWLPALKKYFLPDFDYSTKQYVKQVMGAFIFTRRDIMEKINGWDEKYWLWWEDIELCRRVRDIGEEIVYLPITEVIHYEGQSFKQIWGWQKQKRFNKGLLTYFKKHHPFYQYAVLFALQPISWLLTQTTRLFKILPKTQSEISKK